MPEIIWKKSKGFYWASSTGLIKSKIPRLKREKILKPWTNKKGYMYIKYMPDRKNRSVHSLVFEAFHGPVKNGLCINHKDGNKSNNNIENLEAVTISENIRHAFRNNLNHKGSKHGISKLEESDIPEIRRLYREDKCIMYLISLMYGVDRKTIGDVISGKNWSHVVG